MAGSTAAAQHATSAASRRPSNTTRFGFVFSVKGARFITHMKKLRDVQAPLANFFGSGVLALREKLGPILWQFPPNFKFEPESFDAFLGLLPRDTTAAAALARRHDDKLKFRAYTRTDRANIVIFEPAAGFHVRNCSL